MFLPKRIQIRLSQPNATPIQALYDSRVCRWLGRPDSAGRNMVRWPLRFYCDVTFACHCIKDKFSLAALQDDLPIRSVHDRRHTASPRIDQPAVSAFFAEDAH